MGLDSSIEEALQEIIEKRERKVEILENIKCNSMDLEVGSEDSGASGALEVSMMMTMTLVVSAVSVDLEEADFNKCSSVLPTWEEEVALVHQPLPRHLWTETKK